MFLPELKIRIYDDPCLRQISKRIERVGPVERILVKSMIKTMDKNKGIGLAAPQVGINEQLFVVDIGDGPFAVFNPNIIRRWGSDEMEEGCLSIPNVMIKVTRAKTIEVEYTDENNRLIRRKLTDMLAKVFQHETDHLNGKLIFDYLPPQDQKEVIKKYKYLLEHPEANEQKPTRSKSI